MKWWEEILDDLTDFAWRLPVTLIIVCGIFSMPIWLPMVLEILGIIGDSPAIQCTNDIASVLPCR